jgi:cellulose synthase/poly-beta-1,6-N-acetylglucosamine synthase-like glycosyltransferase
LAIVTSRVDDLEVKVNALNKKVAETCSNMSDVIAYVDANMADMKDFIANIVKKLPTPKRLEVLVDLIFA